MRLAIATVLDIGNDDPADDWQDRAFASDDIAELTQLLQSASKLGDLPTSSQN